MKKIIRKSLALLLVASLFVGANTAYAVGDTETVNEKNAMVIDNVPTTAYVSGVSPYDGTVSVLTEYEAQSAGVPAGFIGSVIRAGVGSNSSYAGVTIDLTSLKLPVAEIEEMTFRVYLAGGTSLRVSNKGAGNWAILSTVKTNTWVDYTVKADGSGFNGVSFEYFNDGNGYFGIFGMGAKSVSCLYLDSISIVFKDGYVYESDDEIPPVITYNGATELNFTEGDTFTLDDLSAFDEYDNSAATVSYEFTVGATNSAGQLQVGTHTCTVKAMDRSGNTSTLDITVNVAPNPSLLKIEEVPHIPYDSTIADNEAYTSIVKELTAEEAAAKGLPTGYNGTVYEINKDTSASYVGVCIDLSGYEIPIKLVESISFNVLVPTNYSELRMRCGNTTDWVMRCASAPTGAWNSVVLSADGFNFYGSHKMDILANDEGNLGAFALIGRVSTTYVPYYIDSITIKLKSDDKVAPVLNYSGKTDILTSAEKAFDPGIVAYDEQEERYVPLSYEWSAGALDDEGRMLEGTHTCRVSATDYYGNVSYLDFNITVGPKDVTPPEILFEASEIVVPVGTYFRMVILALDDYDDVKVVTEWSEGAIDFGGRLYEGTHTLTLTATDLTGNVTVRVVTVRVVNGDSTVGALIQCSK